jgi:membrane-bound lytic murein transglycosylase D
MEAQIRFWRSIFTQYSARQVLLHDARDLNKVYKVLDFRDYLADGMKPAAVERLQSVETDDELERVRATLRRLHVLGPELDHAVLTPEERAIADLFRDDRAPDRFLAAADGKRLRSQRGLKERFAEAISVSRRYLPEMERIFRAEGLPVELTRLPLIESCFNLRAYSKVGAAGIWQFMPSTGRRFMRVDHLVDERRDPISSTRGAAEYLSRLHNDLGSWPLAITAYNHGPNGIARAVDAVGTSDIGTIVREYEGPAFGFASRNFYAEFLAAVEIDRDYQAHFGELRVERPLRTREHLLERSVAIQTAARLAGADRDELALLNPALSAQIVSGRRPIPAGYRLRLPEDSGSNFESRLAAVAAEPRVVPATARAVARKGRPVTRSAFITHRVRKGQTLSHIAKHHGVSVQSLMRANRLRSSSRIRAGQTIRVPVAANRA